MCPLIALGYILLANNENSSSVQTENRVNFITCLLLENVADLSSCSVECSCTNVHVCHGLVTESEHSPHVKHVRLCDDD